MNLLRIAWRNIWRNRARTAIAGGAIALNAAILIVTMGLMQGMLDKTIESLTSMALGQAQVHAPRYRQERSLHDGIEAPEKILARARQAGISAVAWSSGAQFWGVNPASERRAFELPRQILEGRFLSDRRPPPDAEGDRVREVVLGRKLASALEARVGSEVVAVVQAADGSIGNDLFKVVGVFKTVSSDIDRSAALLHREDFDEPAAGHAEVLTWKQIQPGPAQMLDAFSAVMAIFGLIFGLTAGSSVMNSMLMSTFDRLREFGVIKALGGTPLRIVRDVVAEAAMMGLVFGTAGAMLGYGATVYLERHGLNLGTGDQLMLSGVAFDPVWRAVPSQNVAVEAIVLMIFVSMVAALYPAVKAARLNPVVAMTEP